MTRRPMFTALVALVGAAATSQAGVKLLEVTADPPRDGIVQYTCRFAPTETVDYDRLEFEMLYRQDITLPLPGGGTTNRVHEPVWFKYVERNPRLVADLDKYISFRVPLDLDKLRQTYGRKAFQVDSPVSISRIQITAYHLGQRVWVIREKPPGRFPIDPKKIMVKKPGS